MHFKPRPSPVILSIVDGIGKIDPAVVTIDTEHSPSLVINNPTDADITVVFPHGVSGDGSIFGVEHQASISIPINGRAPHAVEIPYWVFFSRKKGTQPPIHDWGKAASPPTMILYP